MKLVFYSNFNKSENETFDKKVVDLINNPHAKFTFIPSQTDITGKYFEKFKEYYSNLGFNNFEYFDIDTNFDHKKLPNLLDSDVIYLSGGTTFRFLENIKNNRVNISLQNFAATSRKVLIGVSAGAMIMTPTIMNTVIHHKLKGDFDQLNTNNLKNFSGLNLVSFEFIPHFSKENKGLMIKKYLPETKNIVYACPDGSGIIVDGNKTFLSENVVKLK